MTTQRLTGVLCALLLLTTAAVAQDKAAIAESMEIAGHLAKLTDKDPGKRYAAVIALSRYRHRDVSQALQGMLDDSEDYIRVAVIQNLRKLHDHTAVPKIIKKLTDRDYFVRVAATGALRSLCEHKLGFDPDAPAANREQKAREWQVWWDKNKAPFLARHAARFKTVKNPVAPKATHRDREVAEVTDTAKLIKRHLAILETRLESPDPIVRVATVLRLKEIGSRNSIPHIIQRLLDDDAFVRIAAVRTLRTLTSQNFGYDPDGPKDDRLRLAGKWASWWEQEAKAAGK